MTLGNANEPTSTRARFSEPSRLHDTVMATRTNSGLEINERVHLYTEKGLPQDNNHIKNAELRRHCVAAGGYSRSAVAKGALCPKRLLPS